MSAKHYHVLSGLHGSMPDINDVCETVQEAKNDLKFWRDIFRDQGVKLSGNIKDEYFEFLNENGYIEISECTESECLEFNDE